MIESFVDLTYRGLQLGRRVKLTHVRPSTGYLELPSPMPIGTPIAIATDEGVVLEAIVTEIHEQVGGSDRTPGMTVSPRLTEDPAQAWWRARVALPEEEPPSARNRPVTLRPRPHTRPQPPASVAVAEPEPSGSTTTMMPVVDQELLEQLTRNTGEIEALVRHTGEHKLVDDGNETSVMEAMDPAALGLIDVSASGSLPASDDDDGTTNSRDGKKSPPGVKKRKKKR